MSKFIHLRAHSTYSIIDGLSFPTALVEKAKKLGYPAIALTDEANLFAALKFFHAAREHRIKPILGMDLRLIDEKFSGYRITVLVKNEEGYRNLMHLATYAQTIGAQNRHRGYVPRDFLAQHSQGLLVLSGAADGDIGHALLQGNRTTAIEHLEWWMELCGNNYYLELQRLGGAQEDTLIAQTLQLAKNHKCPPIATNDVRFLTRTDCEVHRLRVCIQRGEVMGSEKHALPYQATQYLRSPAEMEELFTDIPAALENTVLAAQRCNFILESDLRLPVYPHKGKEKAPDMLKRQAYSGMEKLLGTNWRSCRNGEYRQRLDMELKIIGDMGFSDYFLIVGDFVRWAKSQDIAVGPGRGSGAGSLVAYAVSITGLDPLVHNLFFERFLNLGRASMPDFDIDMCMERRDEVITYIRTTYGEGSTVQIISFGTMGARGAIRDVTRALHKPFGLGDKIARLIPEMPGITLANAVKEQPVLKELIERDADAQNIFEYAEKLEGLVRHTGSHAAGVVITPGAVSDYCPLYADGDTLVTQFDKDDLEAIGLVKFDVLGLRTLTVIDDTLKLIKQHERKELNVAELPLDDEKTLALVRSAQTYAIFQLESGGMRDVARRMKPQSFEDIIALIALFRPGPMELIDQFIKNKQAIEKGEDIAYPHPSLEDILRPTYGIAVYQEQIMQMAETLAGFSLSQADVLRHAMGKKKISVMQQQQQQFIEGAIKQDHKKHKAEEFFTTIKKFAGYGFNRSHSVGYALLAYRTAYLKAHHPHSFLAAAMSSEIQNHKKIARLVEEAQRLKIKILPPDINESEVNFSLAEKGKAIRYGLASIKGVGRRAAKSMVGARQHRPYTGFFDLCCRTEERILTRPLLESLVRAGTFHKLEANQALLMNNIDRGIQHNKNSAFAADTGISDMFAGTLKKEIFIQGETPRPWSLSRALSEEKLALGFALRGDSFSIYKKELRRYIQTPVSAIKPRQKVVVCGRIAHRRNILRSGQRDLVTFFLHDDTSNIAVRVESHIYDKKEHLLEDDNVLIVKGILHEYSNVPYLQAAALHGLEYLRNIYCTALCLEADERQLNKKQLAILKDSMLPYTHKEGLPFYLNIRTDKHSYRVRFLKHSQFTPSNECLEKLMETIPGGSISLLDKSDLSFA